MGEAIGQSLPTAVGVALSPLPIIAVVLMLVTPRGRGNGMAFVIGWIVALAIVGAIVLSLAGGADASSDGDPATWVSVLKLVLGVLMLLLAVRQWRGRGQTATPKWMQALDTFTPAKAGGAGALLAGVNPKNLLLTVAGAAAIAGTGISTSQQIWSYAVFVLVASIGVGAPLVLAFALGERAGPLLERLRQWLAHNNAVIMSMVLLLIGVKLVGDAISAL